MNFSFSSTIWHHHLKLGSGIQGFGVGSLSVYATQQEGDWIVGIHRGEAGDDKAFHTLSGEAPDGTAWRRLGSVDEMPELHIRPAFPNRPVVVRPEFPYTIIPGEKVCFFVGVPVSICLFSPAEVKLLEEPIVKLSNTWFGVPTEGELCYAMRTLARREGEHLDFGPTRVVCPVRVRNQTKETMMFERLCLRVKYLDMYEQAGKGLWANESSVIVRGGESWSRVAYARNAPANLKNPKLLVKGTEDPKGTYLLRAISHGKGFFQ
ncbi:MAG: hypothetical protein WD708_08665 [Kiritimatiellia bacterium]